MVECVVNMQCGDTIHAFAWGDLWATVSGDMASNVMYKTFHQSVNVMQSLTFCLIVCKFVCWALILCGSIWFLATVHISIYFDIRFR